MWYFLFAVLIFALAFTYFIPKIGLLGGTKSFETMYLGDEAYLDHIAPDKRTGITKDKDFFRIYKIGGINYDGKSLGADEQLAHVRSDFWLQIGQSEIDARTFGIKRDLDFSYDAKWPNPVLQEIGAAENKHFSKSADISWYLILSTNELSKLEKAERSLNSTLNNFRPRCLVATEENCEITSFLNYLYCGQLRPRNKSVSTNISANLQASNLDFSRDGILTNYVPRKKLHGFITITEYPQRLHGSFTQELLGIPGDVEVSQIILSGKQLKRAWWFKRKVTELSHSNDPNSTPILEHADVAQKISDQSAAAFDTQFQIILRAETIDELQDQLKEVDYILGPKLIEYRVETEGCEDIWMSRIPGRDFLNPKLEILNTSIATIWPFHHASLGQRTGPYWDKPVRIFKTLSGQGYSAQYHLPGTAAQEPLGHYLMIGPSGSGKSTLMLYLMSGLAKFEGHRSYYFDSKEGSKFMIKALGGLYQDFQNLALNPLDVGKESKVKRQKLKLFLETMLNIQPDDLDHDAEINRLLDFIFSIEGAERNFNNLYEMGFDADSNLKKRMAKWVTDRDGFDGIFSHIFNAPHDSLSNLTTTSFMTGINMNEALADPLLGPLLVMHITDAIEKAAKENGAGFNLFIDEASNLLRNDNFKEAIAVMFREYRRLRGSVGLGFQDAKAVLDTGMANSLLENSAMICLYPNPKADEEALRKLGLQDEHIDFIKYSEAPMDHTIDDGGNPTPKKRYDVLIVKQAGDFYESAVVDVSLKGLGDALRFFKAGSEPNRLVDNLEKTYGADWAQHIPKDIPKE